VIGKTTNKEYKMTIQQLRTLIREELQTLRELKPVVNKKYTVKEIEQLLDADEKVYISTDGGHSSTTYNGKKDLHSFRQHTRRMKPSDKFTYTGFRKNYFQTGTLPDLSDYY
jgi:hypothetical protein